MKVQLNTFIPQQILPLHFKWNLLFKHIALCIRNILNFTKVTIATLINWALSGFLRGEKGESKHQGSSFYKNQNRKKVYVPRKSLTIFLLKLWKKTKLRLKVKMYLKYAKYLKYNWKRSPCLPSSSYREQDRPSSAHLLSPWSHTLGGCTEWVPGQGWHTQDLSKSKQQLWHPTLATSPMTTWTFNSPCVACTTQRCDFYKTSEH